MYRAEDILYYTDELDTQAPAVPDFDVTLKKIEVDFYEVTAGWIFFHLIVGENIFDSVFSAVFDPLPELKDWLEDIALGKEHTSFSYDPEGKQYRFDYEYHQSDKVTFTISEAFGDGNVVMKANASRNQLVHAFYIGFLSFANSAKFHSEEWEIQFIQERLCKITELPETELMNKIVDLDRIELKKLLFQANPAHKIVFTTTKTNNEAQMVPDEVDIPDDYDYWRQSQRADFIFDIINRFVTTGFCASRISEFRSAIIEQYLEKGDNING